MQGVVMIANGFAILNNERFLEKGQSGLYERCKFSPLSPLIPFPWEFSYIPCVWRDLPHHAMLSRD